MSRNDPWTTPADLGDSRVADATQTCRSNPEQYEGLLHDGRWFYFRYRWGAAYVGIGVTLDDAIDDDGDMRDYGGPFAGQWPDEATRDAAFTELLSAKLSR